MLETQGIIYFLKIAKSKLISNLVQLHRNSFPAEMSDDSSFEHKAEHSYPTDTPACIWSMDRLQVNESNDYFPGSPPPPYIQNEVTITFKSFYICRFCLPLLALSRTRSGIFMCSTYMYHVSLRVNVHFN